MVDWISNIGLELNTSKCHVMTYTRCRRSVDLMYSVSGKSSGSSGESVVD